MNNFHLEYLKRMDWCDFLLSAIAKIFVTLVFCFLLGPFAIVFLGSFSSSPSLQFPPRSFSFRWYERFLEHLMGSPDAKPGLAEALFTSCGVATTTALITVFVGVLAGYAIARQRRLGFFKPILTLPIVFPQIVVAIGVLMVFSALKAFSPLERLILGHTIICFPYVLIIVSASFELHDVSLEEAALGLGAGPVRAFMLVTLPLIRPGLIAAAAFAFIVSFSNFSMSYFLSGGGVKTLPIWVFEVIEFYLDPVLAVISVALISMTAVVAIIVDRVVGVGRIVRG